MKKVFLVSILLGCVFQLSAQESVLSSSAESESTTGKISYSVGLIHYKEATGIDGSSTVGTQLPFEVLEVLSIDKYSSSIITVFPNPTENVLNIHLTHVNNFNYQLFDLSGRKVTSGNLNKLESQIELNNIETSIYLLNILKDSKIIKSYKISKI